MGGVLIFFFAGMIFSDDGAGFIVTSLVVDGFLVGGVAVAAVGLATSSSTSIG